MQPSPPPYSNTDLEAAFPEFDIAFPELGLGSFKAAYRVTSAGRTCVLKVVKEPADLPAEAVDVVLPPRLDREIAAMTRVNSPRVVSVLAGPDTRRVGNGNHVWYLEPYFAGGTLESRMTASMPEAEGLRLADGLLEGVEALWTQARLVHRDIKPGNIVFGEAGPVLLDLGIALHTALTPLTNAFAPSPRTERYAAPEQFAARWETPIDTRTDIFLVGLVVTEAITTRHPYNPLDPHGYFDRLRSGQLDDSVMTLITSDPLRAVLRRMLRPNPHERYRNATFARSALREVAI